MNSEMQFSKAINILQDIKRKNQWDIIRIIEKIDEKPITFDFGAGKTIVYRYVIETIDAKLLLFIPAINSFSKKLELKRFYQIGAKRTFNYELNGQKLNEWIIYINRLKNINPIKPKLKDRVFW